MRILHTADWHLGRSLEGRDRMPEHIAFLNELEDIIKSEKIDAMLMAGDVFDTVNPPAAAEELFYETIARINKVFELPIAIIAGNHDHPSRLAAIRSLAMNQNIYIVGLPGVTPIFMPVKGDVLQLGALPYPSESRLGTVFSELPEEKKLRDAYNEKIKILFHRLTSKFDKNKISIAMSHLFVAGGTASDSERPIEVGGAYTVTPDALPENVQYTALGHLHRPQDIKSPDAVARYSGSPLAFSFSEAGYSKSVTIIDVKPGGDPIVEEIPLSCGKPLVRWKAQNGLTEVHNWLSEKRDQNAWVDLEIHVENTLTLSEIQHLRQEHKGIIHIRPIFPELRDKESNAVKRSDLSIDDLFKRFYRQQTGGAEPTQDLTDIFMELIESEGEGE